MVSSSPPDGKLARHQWFHHYRRLVRRAVGGHEIIATEWYFGPMVVNIVTASAQLAVMKVDYHRQLLPTGAKTVGEGGFGAGSDELSTVGSLPMVLGDGTTTRFSTEVWLPQSSVQKVAPCLVSRRGHSRSVPDVLWQRQWVRDIDGAVTTQVLCDYICVWEMVVDIILQPLLPDYFVWQRSSTGAYSAS